LSSFTFAFVIIEAGAICMFCFITPFIWWSVWKGQFWKCRCTMFVWLAILLQFNFLGVFIIWSNFSSLAGNYLGTFAMGPS
jgi:hypothetical protein